MTQVMHPNENLNILRITHCKSQMYYNFTIYRGCESPEYQDYFCHLLLSHIDYSNKSIKHTKSFQLPKDKTK